MKPDHALNLNTLWSELACWVTLTASEFTDTWTLLTLRKISRRLPWCMIPSTLSARCVLWWTNTGSIADVCCGDTASYKIIHICIDLTSAAVMYMYDTLHLECQVCIMVDQYRVYSRRLLWWHCQLQNNTYMYRSHVSCSDVHVWYPPPWVPGVYYGGPIPGL